MPLLCYVHRRDGATPHFEVLAEDGVEAACRHAERLLAERPDAVRAEVWDGDRLIKTIEREAAPTA